MKDQLGHHSIKVTVDVSGHLVPGANKAAVDRLGQQAQALEAAIGQGDDGAVQAGGELIERNPTQSPRNQGSAEKQRGVTSRPVTPRQELVELRGLEPLTPRLPVWSKRHTLRATEIHKCTLTRTCSGRQVRSGALRATENRPR